MEFDQPYNGSVDWSFPSPPTDATSANNVFQTPKTSSFSSYFQDAFTTPQLPSYATPRQQQQQHRASVKLNQSPQVSTESWRSSFGTTVPTQSPVLAVRASGQAGYEGLALSSLQDHNAQMQQQGEIMSFGSLQMQTPPPTRDTSAEKMQQARSIGNEMPSTIASRRCLTPQQIMGSTERMMMPQQAPLQYPQLQFLPDVYQFGNFGSASAPVMSRTRLLREQQTSPDMLAHRPTLEDPFALTGQQRFSPAQTLTQQKNLQSVIFDTPTMDSFPFQPPHPRPANATPTYIHDNFSISPLMDTASAGVNPSFVYSSPLTHIIQPNSRKSKNLPPVRQEIVQRLETNMVSQAGSDTVTSTDPVMDISSTSLRTSNTTGTVRSRTAHPSTTAAEALSRSNSVTHFPRTASPLKRAGKTPLGSISESHRIRPRASIVLTVDENGRARTETRRMNPSPTRSIRDRYPGLFDSESSDDESETSDDPPSRVASFTFPRCEERRSKAARLDASLEDLGGSSIPRSASSLSNRVGPSRAAVAAAAQLRRQGSFKRTTPSLGSCRISAASSASSLVGTCPLHMTAESEQVAGAGDDVLRQSFHTRMQKLDLRHGPTFHEDANSCNLQNSLDAHNRRWSMMSFEHHQQSQSTLHTERLQPSPQDQLPYIHSTQMGLIHGQRHSNERGYSLIRCVCGTNKNHSHVLVQCVSCTQWVHAGCVGLNAQQLPPSFICFLCTKPTDGV